MAKTDPFGNFVMGCRGKGPNRETVPVLTVSYRMPGG